MKEFQTLSGAVSEATRICDEWIIMPGKQQIDAFDAQKKAYEIDQAYAADGEECPYTYLCSEEGAVGLTEGKEYMAQWIMLPLPDVSNDLEEQIRADYEREHEVAGTKRKFCKMCGKQIPADASFCKFCGIALK